ncbi:MAG: hypothetical protein AAGA68_02220 [Pseudomonadota bacterium]
MLTQTFIVADHERGVLYENGQIKEVLGPGTYRYFDPLKRKHVETFDHRRSAFARALTRRLARSQGKPPVH